MDYMKLDIQLFADGKVVIDTELNTKNFENGLDKMQDTSKKSGSTIKNIVAGLGITQLISKGMQVISSSIDDAVKRVDTLNNFPKVMKNLGISAEDSSKAINKMSDKLAGLPTTLDQGASAVQRFTSKNGDVKKSTDIFLALNNAILAGGASSEIQATALEQLSQSYAKGKPDMMEWRSAMTAMPAQLKQVAQAMGYINADELGEALRNGTVSMDEFMDTIVELNTKGVEGFASFEKQARNSTGGVGTAITVAKTQVVKGVADIVQKLNEGLQEANLPNISEIITNLGKKSKEVLDTIANNLPSVINLIKEMIPYLTTIGVIIASWKIGSILQSHITKFQEAKLALALFVGQAKELSVAQALLNGTLTKGEGIVALLTGKLKLAQLAQAAFNTVIKANPIGLIVTAIVGLISALVILYKKNEEFRNSVNEAWNSIKEALLSAWETLKPALDELWEAMQELWVAIQPIAEFIVNVLVVAINVLVEVLKFLIPIITQVIIVAIDLTTKVIKVVTQVVTAIIKFFTETIPNAFNNFVTTVQDFINKVIDFFKNLPENIGYLIGLMIGYIINFGVEAINWVKNDLPKIINNIIDWFKQLPGKIWTTLVSVISKIIEWGTNLKQKGKEASKKLFDSIVNGIKDLPGKMLDIGKNIVEGLWNGIKNAKDWLSNKIKDFTGGITNGIKKALGIHSPSTVMRDEVGKYVAQGIGVGFEDELGNIYKDMQRAIDLETSKMTANVQTSGTYQVAMSGSPTFNLSDNSTDRIVLEADGRKLAEVVNTHNRNREVAKA